MKVERKIQVAATPTEAFAKLSDVKVLASLLTGLMDWTATDEPNRFRTVFRAGPAPLGGEIELVASRVAEWVFARTGHRFMGIALTRLARSIEAQPPRRRGPVTA